MLLRLGFCQEKRENVSFFSDISIYLRGLSILVFKHKPYNPLAYLFFLNSSAILSPSNLLEGLTCYQSLFCYPSPY